ncbi:MAG: thioredoxin family protein [Spirochaetales bacterium]|nr:thioredoxin family protein [Spirochaetales bacterium]
MKKILLTVFSLTLLTAGAFANGTQETHPASITNNNDTMMKSNMMMASSASTTGFYDLTGLGPQIVPFTSEADAQALAKNETVIYFFAASWCPTCQATYKNLKADYAQIPPNVTLVVVNYDTAKALEQKYGVTSQHTFVEIDANGNLKKIWSGTTSVQAILAKA